MKIKKYLVKSVDEALEQIKRELGAEAFILSTRKVQQRGQLNLSSHELVEVVAAAESASLQKEVAINHSGHDSIYSLQSKKTALELKERQIQPGNVLQLEDKLAPLTSELSEIKRLLKISTNPLLEREQFFSGIFAELYLELVSGGVEVELAKKVIALLLQQEGATESKREVLWRRMVQIVAAMIGEAQPLKLKSGQRKVGVFVGPTGVGKTTTIAKLAAYFRLLQARKVVLISIDSYRIGAEQQLRIYADLLQIPFYAVYNYQDLQFRLDQLADYELVLIDTTGRCGFDREGLLQNRGVLQAIPVNCAEIFLVIAATTKTEDLFQVWKNFALFNPSRLLISKLDETVSLGNVFSLKVSSGLPVSYFTTGQRVPEDIEVVKSQKFARFVCKKAFKEDL